MTCEELDARLDDWLDGTLPPAEARRVEAHLAACAACRESERRLRQLLAHAAALPRSVTPPRDLWPGIARRIEGRDRLAGAPRLGPLARARRRRDGRARRGGSSLAGAAARGRAHGRDPRPRAGARGGLHRRPPSPTRVLAQAERDYESAANALLAALQQRRAPLAAGELERVQANLQVIDRALAEVRQALASDPENPELNRMLVATHRKKVDVLRRVVRLSTEL